MLQPNSSVSNCTSWIHGPPSQTLAPSVVLALCFFIGVPGNIVVIMVILRNFKKGIFTVRLMLNLAVSDFLCLVSLPVWVYAIVHGWTLGTELCKFFSYFVYCSQFVSVWTVTLMSVQRYIQILYSKDRIWLRLRGTVERVLLVSLWIVGGALASPAIFYSDAVCRRDRLRCQKTTSSDAEKVVVLLLETLFGFLVPFFIIVVFYLRLHKKLNQHPLFHNERTTKLVSRIIAAFFIFWIPLHIINMVDIASVLLRTSNPGAYNSLKKFRRISGDFSKALIFINCCVNPFLYTFASRNLRRDFGQSGSA
ncbi:leukotriene B4 receptor 1-like [Paramormyrops kingsleyae]|nr:leukotriene B4 receptor 1-like [Paramormyrops kingsleyae]